MQNFGFFTLISEDTRLQASLWYKGPSVKFRNIFFSNNSVSFALNDWESDQLLESVRSFDTNRIPFTVPFFLWRRNATGILRTTKNSLRREELFARLNTFLDESIAVAILSVNLPAFRRHVQPMRWVHNNRELFLPSEHQIEQIKTAAMHGKDFTLFLFAYEFSKSQITFHVALSNEIYVVEFLLTAL